MSPKLSAALPGLLAASLVIAAAMPADAQNAAPRLAYIDSNAIIEQAPGAREVREELEQLESRFREELEGMRTELEEMVQQYERQRGTMSQQRREEREQEIGQREQAMYQRMQQLDQEFGQRQSELVEPIMRRIQAVIEDIRTEGNYTMIFDAPVSGLIAADPSVNITDQVVTRLRETANR